MNYIAAPAYSWFLDGCAKSFFSFAIQFAVERGFHLVLFESDSSVVVQLSSSLDPLPWVLDAIIHDIRGLLCIYPQVKISFVPRSANLCADLVAKAVSRGQLFSGWTSNHPSEFAMLLSQDCNSSVYHEWMHLLLKKKVLINGWLWVWLCMALESWTKTKFVFTNLLLFIFFKELN